MSYISKQASFGHSRQEWKRKEKEKEILVFMHRLECENIRLTQIIIIYDAIISFVKSPFRKTCSMRLREVNHIPNGHIKVSLDTNLKQTSIYLCGVEIGVDLKGT